MMKKFKPGWKTGLLALVSIPLLLTAAEITSPNPMKVSTWGIFGPNLTTGTNVNVAVGQYNSWDSAASNTLTVGSYLTAYDSHSLVVGYYNQDSGDAQLFVVANGSSENPLEVFSDGRVLVTHQGEVEVGNYSGSRGLLAVGQLKHAATEASDELETLLPGGAGYALDNSFAPPAGTPTPQWYDEQRNAAVLGQVKAVAAPLYGRLNDFAAGWVQNEFATHGIGTHPHAVPWNPDTPGAENYQVASVGQLQLVYALDLDAEDGDSVPDLVEYFLHGEASGDSATRDYDGDGLMDAGEITKGTSLLLADTDGDGLDDLADHDPLTASTGGTTATQLYVWTPGE